MKTFVPLVEHNDHEGETWTQWLQVEGNEEELVKVVEYLHKWDELQDTYELDMNDREPEDVVDRMCARAQAGYTWSDSKVVGRLTTPTYFYSEEFHDDFYKGGIERHFKV